MIRPLAWNVQVLGGLLRVVFSDDTSEGPAIKDEPISVTAAVMFDMDGHWEPFVRDYEAILNDCGFSIDQEPKGSKSLRQAAGGVDKSKRLMDGIIALPVTHQIPVFYSAVDRGGLAAHWEYLSHLRSLRKAKEPELAQDIDFLDCMSQIQRYTERVSPKERILWIADQAGNDTTAKKFEWRWRRFRETMQEIQSQIEEIHAATGRDRNEIASEPWARITLSYLGHQRPMPPLSRFADALYFGDSKESRALQLADMCCAVIKAFLLGRPGAEYYERLKGVIVNDGTAPMFSADRPWFT